VFISVVIFFLQLSSRLVMYYSGSNKMLQKLIYGASPPAKKLFKICLIVYSSLNEYKNVYN